MRHKKPKVTRTNLDSVYKFMVFVRLASRKRGVTQKEYVAEVGKVSRHFFYSLRDKLMYLTQDTSAVLEEKVGLEDDAKENHNVNWILKIHPANKWRNELESINEKSLEEVLVKNLFKKLPENIFILDADTDVSTYSLFKFIDFGLTVRGTVGCELSCFGIPVFTAGTGRYSHQGFTIDSNNKNDYKRKIKNIHNYKRLSKKQVKRAKVYSYGSLIARSIPMDGIEIKYNLNNFMGIYHSDVFFKNIKVKELVKKVDLRLFLDWFNDKKLSKTDKDLIHIK